LSNLDIKFFICYYLFQLFAMKKSICLFCYNPESVPVAERDSVNSG